MRRQPARGLQVETHADTQRLLHELQVHQIELDMQNEELKQSKAEVEAGLEKYTDLYDFAPVGYFSLDEQGLILEVNLTGASLLGVERASLNNRRFQLFVAPRSRPAFNVFLGRVFAGHERQICEVSLLHIGSTNFWADLQAMSAATFSGDKRWCRVAVIDIAARKEAEETQRRIDVLNATNRQLEEDINRRQVVETNLKKSEQHARELLEQSRQFQKRLRQMSHQLLIVQENQRREISRELHDKISQLLIGINVHLANFTKDAARNPRGIRKTITPIRRLVRKSVRVIHDFARELRPAMLDDLGLIPALLAHIKKIPKRKGRRIEFAAFKGVEALDNDKRTAIYRVAQEALVNITKHSKASLVKVFIFKTRRGVCLEISDNGKAFDVNRLSSTEWGHCLGISGMRERMEIVGGCFSIVSARGTGTTIRAEVPLGKSPSRK